MKFIREAWYEVGKPEGAASASGDRFLRRHKFNFVRYGNVDDSFVEPINVSDTFDLDTNVVVGEGTEQTVTTGFEILNQLEATGFDDPRSIA